MVCEANDAFGNGQRIIPIDEDVAKEWALLRNLTSQTGIPISTEDAFVLATARHRKFALVGDPSEFTHQADIQVITP